VSPSLQIGQLANGDTEKFGRKLLGENDVEETLKRLNGLTRDEAQLTAAQTLEVVYLLVQNMRVVMDGEYILTYSVHEASRTERLPFRGQGVA
jgi:hypothetical protein